MGTSALFWGRLYLCYVIWGPGHFQDDTCFSLFLYWTVHVCFNAGFHFTTRDSTLWIINVASYRYFIWTEPWVLTGVTTSDTGLRSHRVKFWESNTNVIPWSDMPWGQFIITHSNFNSPFRGRDTFKITKGTSWRTRASVYRETQTIVQRWSHVSPYYCWAFWISGWSHVIASSLTRYPVNNKKFARQYFDNVLWKPSDSLLWKIHSCWYVGFPHVIQMLIQTTSFLSLSEFHVLGIRSLPSVSSLKVLLPVSAVTL